MRRYIPDESVDLIYLDPPFNSKRDYNVLFKGKSGEASPAQIETFTDTWAWDLSAERTYADLIQNAPANIAQMIGAFRQFIGGIDMMAYLVMMTARLIELHRVLKPTGSFYLHCDPTAATQPPAERTGPMRKEAAEAGFYHSEAWQRDYPKIQIATIAALLAGNEPAIPHGVLTFGRGPRIGAEPAERQTGFAFAADPQPADEQPLDS